MSDNLAALIALGKASPECIFELSNGRGEDNDDERFSELCSDKPEYKRDSKQSD